MAFYVYILQSEQDGTFYKGYTEQPLERLKQHNNQESSYTSSKVPWKLVGLLVFATKKEALIKEKKLKKYSKESLISLINSTQNILQHYLASVG